jgi:hypothetical protein
MKQIYIGDLDHDVTEVSKLIFCKQFLLKGEGGCEFIILKNDQKNCFLQNQKRSILFDFCVILTNNQILGFKFKIISV